MRSCGTAFPIKKRASTWTRSSRSGRNSSVLRTEPDRLRLHIFRKGVHAMKKGFIGLMSVLLGMMIQAPSVLAGTLVEFEGGIGVIAVSSAAGTQNADGTFPNVNRNDVRGIGPGGQPWVIRTFEAKIKENGDIRAEGR